MRISLLVKKETHVFIQYDTFFFVFLGFDSLLKAFGALLA